MRRFVRNTLLVGGILLGLAAAYRVSRPQPPEVSLQVLTTGRVEATVANTRAGTVRACQRSRLSMPTGGTVVQLNVKAGDRVEAGTLLLALDDREYQAAVQQAAARLQATERKRSEICFGAERDQRELQRQEALSAKKLAAEETVDQARTLASMSRLACRAAEAQIDEARAALRLAEVQRDRTRLTAPFAGVVAEVNGEIGEYVTPSPPGIVTPPAVDLIDERCLYVRAPIDEVDTARIRVGMPARVTLDAFRGQALAATVTRIAPYVQDYEKQARTVDVEATLVERPQDMNLLVGYSADLEIILEAREDVLRVPTELILEDDTVLRLDEDRQQLERVPFTAGLRNWIFTEVREGLRPGDRILASLDVEGASEGAQVRARRDDAERSAGQGGEPGE